jgi:HPt (histidine-containing phosphotransfer) domain-containing protein
LLDAAATGRQRSLFVARGRPALTSGSNNDRPPAFSDPVFTEPPWVADNMRGTEAQQPKESSREAIMVAFAGVIDRSSAFSTTSRPPATDAIDLRHLSRMTLGERSLEREVLALFDRQVDMLLPRIRGGAANVAAASAHTLKGSAVGIGAWRVAHAAEALEQAKEAEVAAAVDALDTAIAETKAEIARLLRAH